MHCKPSYKSFLASENLADLKRGFGRRQKTNRQHQQTVNEILNFHRCLLIGRKFSGGVHKRLGLIGKRFVCKIRGVSTHHPPSSFLVKYLNNEIINDLN